MKQQEIDFLIRFIMESDAIEGMTNDYDTLKKQLESETVEGHAGSILHLEQAANKPDYHLTVNDICLVQKLITSAQHKLPGGTPLEAKYIGTLRKVFVRIANKIPPRPELVPQLIAEWIESVKNFFRRDDLIHDQDMIRQIARLHFQYETIHPFADGNGRSGRALVYYMFKKCGIRPFIFTSMDRYNTYYKCFDQPESMEEYFVSRT